MALCKVLTVSPENCHHRFYALDELESEMQCATFDVGSILPLNQRSRTGHQDLGTCRALYLAKLDP